MKFSISSPVCSVANKLLGKLCLIGLGRREGVDPPLPTQDTEGPRAGHSRASPVAYYPIWWDSLGILCPLTSQAAVHLPRCWPWPVAVRQVLTLAVLGLQFLIMLGSPRHAGSVLVLLLPLPLYQPLSDHLKGKLEQLPFWILRTQRGLWYLSPKLSGLFTPYCLLGQILK